MSAMERCSVPSKKKKKRDSQTFGQDTIVKKSQSGTANKDCEEKHVSVNTRTYAYISPETITKIAESVGFHSINEDIAINLAEDVSYKLQEIISASCTIMRCCKRRRLQTSDVSAALKVADTPPIFGHSVNNPFNFISVPEAEVFVGEDNEVDLSSVALGSVTVTQPKPSHIAISWPVLENMLRSGRGKHSGKANEKSHSLVSSHSKITPVNGEVKQEKLDELVPYENSVHADAFQNPGNLYTVSESLKGISKSNSVQYFKSSWKSTSCGTSVPGIHTPWNTNVNQNGSVTMQASGKLFNLKRISHQNLEEEVHLSSAQFTYFHTLSNCILRGTDGQFQQAISDLHSNQKLGIVVAPILNLVALTVYHVPRHFGILMRLLETIDALLGNQYCNPSFSISINRLVNALLAISSDQNVILSDDFLLRRKAGHLLARILAEWNVEERHVNELLSRVALVLGDSREPIQSQYGALVIFQSLGKPVLQTWVLPLLVKYLPQLEQRSKLTSSSTALQMEEIRGVLLNIVEVLNCNSKDIAIPTTSTVCQQVKAMAQLDDLLYEYVGDAACARRIPSSLYFCHLKRNETQFELGKRNFTRGDLRHKTSTSNLFSIHFHGSSAGSSVRRNIQPGVFQDVPSLTSTSRKEIHFRFAGANPVPREKLRRKVLDKTHAQFVDHIHGPLHSLYQRQFPMVGHMFWSKNKTLSKTSIVCHSLLTVL